MSQNPFPASFGDESDHQFFSTIGEVSAQDNIVHVPENLSQFNSDAAISGHRDQGQGEIQNGPQGAEETYFPAQGYRRSLDTKDNTCNGHGEGRIEGEDPPPPPPTSFFDQVPGKQPAHETNETEAQTAMPGKPTFAPPPPPQMYGSSGVGHDAAMTQEKDASLKEQDIVPHPINVPAVGKYGRDLIDDDSSDDEDAREYRAFREGGEGSREKVNANLQAGRRKLEEFKRKKAAALSRKNSLSQQREIVRQEFAETKLDEAREEIERLRNEVRQLSADVESQAKDKAVVEREKAALLGELMSIKAQADANPGDSSDAIDLLRDEIHALRERTENLESSLIASRSECAAMTEEKSKMEEELRALRIQVALPVTQDNTEVLEAEIQTLRMKLDQITLEQTHAASHQDETDLLKAEIQTLRMKINDMSLEKDNAAIHQDDTDALRAEIQTLQANLEQLAIEKEQELEEAAFESRENIDSLRELLSEGEQERVDLVEQIQKLNQEVALSRGVDQDKAQYLSRIQDLETQLLQAQQEARELKEKLENSVETRAMSPVINPGADGSLETLKLRLAKAEAAVEAERQAYQALEQKSKQWQGALEENVALRNQMMELREREKTFEQHMHMDYANNVPLSNELQQAVERAQAAEHEANGLYVELEKANNTITSLSGEVNDLITRLKEQSQVIVEMKQKEATFESVPINEAPSSPPQAFMEQPTPIFEAQPSIEQQGTMYQESYQPNETSLFDLYQQPNPPSHQPSHIGVERSNDQEIPQQPIPWSVPGGIIEPEPTNTSGSMETEAQPAPRKVGFWSWVAGADLAS